MREYNLCAGGVFVTPKKEVIFQIRDNKAGISHPGKIHVFGGVVEPGESKWQAFLRELNEETGLPKARLCLARFLMHTFEEVEGLTVVNHVSVFVVPDVRPDEIEVLEGEGIFAVSSASQVDERFTDLARNVYKLVSGEILT